MLGKLVGWMRGEDNREAALAMLSVATAVLTGGWFLYERLAPAEGGPADAGQSIAIGGNAGGVQQVGEGGLAVMAGAGAIVTVGYTIEQHEAALAQQEKQIRRDLGRAHTAERALLQRELDEVRRRAADLEGSFETRRRELADRQAALLDMSGGLPQAQLDAALAALGEGDTGKAEALLAQVQEMEAASVARSAQAAFERGKLAEGDVRWADAAEHYATAARLEPSYDHLFAAREMAWRSGEYGAALRHGADLLAAAVAEHGEGSEAHATALNEHALTLAATGRYGEAEPLYREALAIGEKTLGKAHPDYAARLDNLAVLLRATGRYGEAEPLNREALAIDEKALGKAHPDYVTDLNNLALLLADTGRYGEAEPLYREALAIGEKTLGKTHPTYATSLNNLALLISATGRYGEAEPLYREALAIAEKTLGKAHPAYATRLNNLARLLEDTGRTGEAEPLYVEALAVLTAGLGAEHPSTRLVAANLAALRGAKEAGTAAAP